MTNLILQPAPPVCRCNTSRTRFSAQSHSATMPLHSATTLQRFKTRPLTVLLPCRDSKPTARWFSGGGSNPETRRYSWAKEEAFTSAQSSAPSTTPDLPLYSPARKFNQQWE